MPVTALTQPHMREMCKQGQGEAACAFLVFDPAAMAPSCAKGTTLAPLLARRREAKMIRSRGDNCSGPPDFTPNS